MAVYLGLVCILAISTETYAVPIQNISKSDVIYTSLCQVTPGSLYQNGEIGCSNISEALMVHGSKNITTFSSLNGVSETTKAVDVMWANQYAYILHLIEVRNTLLWYMTAIVDPITGVLGIVGNTLSLVIIYRSGMGKSSNILLFCLGIADILVLLGAVNIGNLTRYYPSLLPRTNDFWFYPKDTSYAMYVLCNFFQLCTTFGVTMSAAICTLITCERLLAVYFPLHFKTLVTSTRTWLTVTLISIFWFSITTYLITFYTFAVYAPNMYYITLEHSDIYQTFAKTLTTPVAAILPFCLVVTGSALIAIRVSMASRKRQQMQNSSTKPKKSSSRMTRTLLAVCVLFSLANVIGLGVWFYPFELSKPDKVVELVFFIITYRYLHYLNSTCNFFIYVAFNAKFRKILLEMLSRKNKIGKT